MTYQICEVLNATNCDTADVTIQVDPAVIVANDDDYSATPVNGLTGGTTATVYSNDTLNGAAFANGDVTPSITADGGLTGVGINADGTLSVPAGTAAGTYTVTYQICEVLNATNCDTATATITALVDQVDLSLTKTVDITTPLVATNITFTLTVTNALTSTVPATGVVVTDVIPAGFTYVSHNTLNGSYNNATGEWSLTNPLAIGASATLGLTVSVNVPGPYTNYAEITAALEVDPDSTPNNGPRTPDEDDDASVTVTPTQDNPSLGKSVSGSNQTFTVGTDVAIGEIVEYTVNINVPPGVFNNTQMVDTMDRGLSFMDCVSITGTGLTTSVGSLTTVCDNAVSDNPGTTTVDDGRRVTFDLGTLTNSSGSDQTLSFVYTAVVLDNADNVSGLTLNNSAQLILGSTPLTPVRAAVNIVEPDLSISKTANTTLVAVGSEVTITLNIQHTANSETNAYDVLVTDALPTELELVTGTLECTSGAQDATTCSYDTGTRTVRAIWNSFALGGGNGRVTFRVRIMSLPPGGVSNIANVAWTSLPGDVSTPQTSNAFSTERDYDPASQVDVYGTSDTLVLGVFNGAVPATGFAPNVVTDLSKVRRENYSQAGNMTVEIPALGINLPVVGVSLNNGEWNVAWLGNQAGWLEGSAFPTWSGNSVLTSHVYGANGLPGPFVKLNTLKYGDKIVIHAYGKKYVYEVRANKVVNPNDASIFNHETKSWLTLVTCKEYDEATNTYKKRVVVRAVLVSVE
ncbi:MAG: sortase [Anaerolineales bacterium]|nr:sortase [Anaerolineales bacterium]